MTRTFGDKVPHDNSSRRRVLPDQPSSIPMPVVSPTLGERQHILKLGWETIHTMVDTMAMMILPLKPHLVVGIARGGLVPATLLSHKLNVPLDVISASAYEGTRRTLQKPIVVVGWRTHYNTPGVIVIDDILDSGDTFNAILNLDAPSVTRWKFATLVRKIPSNHPNMERYVMQVPKETWVQFPWEQAES